MGIEITPVTAVAIVSALLLSPALALLVDCWWGSPRVGSVARALMLALVAGSCWMLVWALTSPELDPRLVLPVAGLAGVASTLVTVPFRERSTRVLAAVSAAWTLLVFSPSAIALFSTFDGVLGSGLGTLDLGGACAVLITAGAGMTMQLVLGEAQATERLDGAHRSILPVLAAVWALWVGWLVGLELVIDDATPRIIVNTVVAPLAAACAWLIVQRIRHAQTTSIGAAGGVLCGLAAVTAGCGFIDPLGALLTGAIAGTVCSLVGYGLVRRTGRVSWLLALLLAIGASLGVILLGIFATRSGLLFTGQPELLFTQFASAALTAVFTAMVSSLIWFVVRLTGIRPRATSGRP